MLPSGYYPAGLWPAGFWPGYAASSDGYNVYRGVNAVDWNARQGSSSTATVTLTEVLSPSTVYEFGVRPIAGGLETPDFSATVKLETDAGGDWVGAKPLAAQDGVLSQQASAALKVLWQYRTGSTTAAAFDLWIGKTAPTGAGAADASVTFTGDGSYSHAFSGLDDGDDYYVLIRARAASGALSDGLTVGPVAADGSAPSTPVVTVSTTWVP
jgi:hypothetical protein